MVCHGGAVRETCTVSDDEINKDKKKKDSVTFVSLVSCEGSL